uniref:EKA-like protein n=1 Tax=Bursaphelenchus xylophilus TaxID=6326 RepID=A0A1I7RPV9_BURXY
MADRHDLSTRTAIGAVSKKEMAPEPRTPPETENKGAEATKELPEPPKTGTELLLSIYTSIAKGVNTFWQLCRIFYQFLCLLYQYPNATHIAIQATYKSLKLLYQSGLWDPLQGRFRASADGKKSSRPTTPRSGEQLAPTNKTMEKTPAEPSKKQPVSPSTAAKSPIKVPS